MLALCARSAVTPGWGAPGGLPSLELRSAACTACPVSRRSARRQSPHPACCAGAHRQALQVVKGAQHAGGPRARHAALGFLLSRGRAGLAGGRSHRVRWAARRGRDCRTHIAVMQSQGFAGRLAGRLARLARLHADHASTAGVLMIKRPASACARGRQDRAQRSVGRTPTGGWHGDAR